jgi:hypothetical protein
MCEVISAEMIRGAGRRGTCTERRSRSWREKGGEIVSIYFKGRNFCESLMAMMLYSVGN